MQLSEITGATHQVLKDPVEVIGLGRREVTRGATIAKLGRHLCL
ncbi:unannotated protein [freshwater metagenome]|uniref:Unannotated protein n=1 Tax=freshwater metagenome TaxID=449393 RepID=A0A6J7GFV6_9ZZZZ